MLGGRHGLFEVGIHALKQARGADHASIRDALRDINYDSICGHINFKGGMFPNVCSTPIERCSGTAAPSIHTKCSWCRIHGIKRARSGQAIFYSLFLIPYSAVKNCCIAFSGAKIAVVNGFAGACRALKFVRVQLDDLNWRTIPRAAIDRVYSARNTVYLRVQRNRGIALLPRASA